MNKERIKDLLADEGFVGDLLKLETPEEVQAAFKHKDVGISIDEVMQLKDFLVKAGQKGGEILLNEMDDAAGGSPAILFGEMFTVIQGPVVSVPDPELFKNLSALGKW